MLRRYHATVRLLFQLLDVLIVSAVWLHSYDLRFNQIPLLPVTHPPSFDAYAALTPVVAILWISIFLARNIYKARRITHISSEIVQLLTAHTVALLLFVVLAYFFEHYKYSRLLIVYFGLISAAALCGLRVALRYTLRKIRRLGYNQRCALIVGDSTGSRRTIEYISKYPELGLRIAGLVTRDAQPIDDLASYTVLGRFEDVKRLCRERDIHEIFVALSNSEQKHMDAILAELKNESASVRLIPDVETYAVLGCASEDFDGMPVVHINDSPLEGVAGAGKRLLDIVGALVALIVFSPVMVVAAIAVKLSSRGPIFYAQERTGLDGQPFMMYKFRSMKVEAEKSKGAQWCTKEDDRRTAVGTFLRKTSLDELPQLWNVLRGEMSLVGPRPERPVFVHQFRDKIPQYMLRHKVKAGITGWAQVNGWRGDTSLESRIECDLFYIRNWSLLFDIKILILTIWKGFVHENAY
ncbi:MAG: undecaprenyl-phosphate glucose phosphotransferase [Myxococcales bacterium]|nr:undecaprenyl-phosphate glucose phosphotransferase [Myxococcales bacterium]